MTAEGDNQISTDNATLSTGTCTGTGISLVYMQVGGYPRTTPSFSLASKICRLSLTPCRPSIRNGGGDDGDGEGNEDDERRIASSPTADNRPSVRSSVADSRGVVVAFYRAIVLS